MSDSEPTSGAASFLSKIWQRIALCPRGKHKRSISHVRQSGETFVSRCRGCGTPMVRKSKRNWIVDTRGL